MIILWDLTALRKEINGGLQECLHRNQKNSKEEPKMRRVRNHKSSNSNPLAMFAVGVEQIVSDQMSQQSKYDDQELRTMQCSPKKQVDKGGLFSVLLQQLFWQNAGRQS
jgi:hypothetical protein